jgi:predicted metal-binding membrane protein
VAETPPRVTNGSPADAPPGVPRRRDRAAVLTYAALLVVTAAAWWETLSHPMGADDMAGMSMAMAPTIAGAVAYVIAWGVMMVAMMLPSALPMIGLYAATLRDVRRPLARLGPVAVFALAYIVVWAVTGVPVYLGSLALMAVGAGTLAYIVAAVLIAAGIYQLSPLKQVCLRHCRSPLGFLLGHWRSGWLGALRLGTGHAVYCVGCCWALMLVLVAAGAMGLVWVLLIASLVAVEKLLPGGDRVARLSGLALLLLGGAVALRPDLATALRGGAMM